MPDLTKTYHEVFSNEQTVPNLQHNLFHNMTGSNDYDNFMNTVRTAYPRISTP